MRPKYHNNKKSNSDIPGPGNYESQVDNVKPSNAKWSFGTEKKC